MPGKEHDLKKTYTQRIGEDFHKEILEVKKERIRRGYDKKKRSTRRLTNIIVKHDFWPQMKEQLIELNLEGNDEDEE